MNELLQAPDGYVRVRNSMRREEALVVQGLMEATGIPSAIVAVDDAAHAYTRQPAMWLALYVVADRAEEADTLLREELVADPGDAGTE